MLDHGETKYCRGQSTVEYILVVAAIIVVILVFLGKNGIFQNALNAIYDTNINSMLNVGERILR